MLVYLGNRTIRIGKYTDHQHYCTNCHSYGLTVKVYKQCFHAFYIPIIPDGPKTVKIHCNNCGALNRNDTLEKEYANRSRVPFYIFSGLILVACVAVWAIFANIKTHEQSVKFVEDPKVNDVYQMKDEGFFKTSCYFLRITKIQGDTVVMYRNNLIYSDIVSHFNDDDFFVKEWELYFTKTDLKKMMNEDKIGEVKRDYGSEEGFDRIK